MLKQAKDKKVSITLCTLLVTLWFSNSIFLPLCLASRYTEYRNQKYRIHCFGSGSWGRFDLRSYPRYQSVPLRSWLSKYSSWPQMNLLRMMKVPCNNILVIEMGLVDANGRFYTPTWNNLQSLYQLQGTLEWERTKLGWKWSKMSIWVRRTNLNPTKIYNNKNRNMVNSRLQDNCKVV